MSVVVPPNVHQVVLFSSGPWGERICGNAELNNAEQIPITIGKLTPYNKYVQFDRLSPIKPTVKPTTASFFSPTVFLSVP